MVAWVFYDAWWGLLCLPIVVYANGKRYADKKAKTVEKQFMVEYKEFLLGLISSLESGYSVENAFVEAEQTIVRMFGKNGVIAGELHRLNAKVALKNPVEQAFLEFAAVFSYEEAENFANIFVFAKRLGGDYIKNIRRTAEKIEEKVELKQEITAAVAEKQMELNVMTVMPMAIITYLRIGSGEFLAPMYHNFGGAVFMTGCICLYAAAIVLGKKIVDIRV